METKYVDVKGTRTRSLEAGSGEPMLLVHGGNFGRYCSANDWDRNIDSLAGSYHVFAIDKIACGFTDNPQSDGEFVIGASVSHARDFLDVMGIDSAHVVGHSRGGLTACRLVLESPGAVRTLVIVDSATLIGLIQPYLLAVGQGGGAGCGYQGEVSPYNSRQLLRRGTHHRGLSGRHDGDRGAAQVHILNEAGHFCFREQPGAFEAAVTGFIETESVGPASQ